jgi:hypothetical protein
MRSKLFLMLFLMLSLLLMCSKDSDNTPTDPGIDPGDNNGGGTITSFVLSDANIFTELPDMVTVMFKVTDLGGKGADFLTIDRFQITEEETRLNNSDVSAYVLKKNDLNYTVRTKILIDNNAGTNLAVLKQGALQLIQNMDFQQEFAVYAVAEELVMVADYTSDANALTAAINSIEEAGTVCNLYDGIMKAKRDRDEYTMAAVTQYTYAIFTDSNDEAGTIQQDAIGPLTSQVKIYTVGYGSVNGDLLDDIGVAYYSATDDAGVVEAAGNMQAEILKYANSLYRLSYRSNLRNGSGHSLKITVSGNTNTENTGTLAGTFSSSAFVDVDAGLYVNWSYSNPEGIDLIMVRFGTSRTVKLLSMGGAKQANFVASSADQSVASVAVGAGGLLTITANGADGDSTVVTIQDVANSQSKDITVKLVAFMMGTVLYERWDGVSGTAVNDLTSNPKYPSSPDVTLELEEWRAPAEIGDNYGVRIRGYIHPGTSGTYTFWTASDDASSVLLSTDDNPENATRICYVSGWTNATEWTKETNQKSASIQLEAGKAYYMESLFKEGTGGDNHSVAWQIEGGKREVIGSDFISFYLGD